jgi:hypothetical protein
MLGGGRNGSGLQIAARDLSPPLQVNKKGGVPVREKSFMYFATSITRRCF